MAGKPGGYKAVRSKEKGNLKSGCAAVVCKLDVLCWPASPECAFGYILSVGKALTHHLRS